MTNTKQPMLNTVGYSIDCATRNAMLAARDLVAKLSVIAR